MDTRPIFDVEQSPLFLPINQRYFSRIHGPLCAIILGTIVFLNSCSSPKTRDISPEEAEISVSYNVLAERLNIPWEILWGNDQALWMTNHFPNNIIRLDPDLMRQDTFTVSDSALDAIGDHFIMGLEQHPSFPEEPYFFVSHNYFLPGDPSVLALSCKKYRLDAETNTLVEPQLIVEGIYADSSMIPGGRLKIIGDSLLLLATSDENDHNVQSRNPNSLSGKFLCFDLEGRPIGDASTFENSIFAIGTRNPQGIAETEAGELFFCDHGPTTDDEVNRLIPGGDYGWPDVLGPCDTEQEKPLCIGQMFMEPMKSWTPTIAPSSLTYYNHPRYPELKNSLLLTTLKEADIRILSLDESRTRIVHEAIILDTEFGRIRDIAVSDDGRVFLTTANNVPKGFKYGQPDRKQDLPYDAVVEVIFESEP